MKTGNRVIEAYELYYRKDGQKYSVLLNNKTQVKRFKERLKVQRRKYLGSRPLKLVEVLD